MFLKCVRLFFYFLLPENTITLLARCALVFGKKAFFFEVLP